MAMDAASQAKAHAVEAARRAAEVITLPTAPNLNTLGEQLRDSFHAARPQGELLIPVRIDIDGNRLAQPVDVVFNDTVIWNVYEDGHALELFARLTCTECGLPASFEEAIAQQLRRASASALQAAGGTPAPTDGAEMVTLDLQVNHTTGVQLTDRVLWGSTNSHITPEVFARQLCSDLSIPELENIICVATRERLNDLCNATTNNEYDAPPPAPTETFAVVRTERDALEWSPMVTFRGGLSFDDIHGVEAKEAERRDRLRKRDGA